MYRCAIIGEIKHGSQINKSNKGAKYIWLKCLDCDKERWVEFRKGKPDTQRCPMCANKHRTATNNCNWKGGRIVHVGGYIRIKVQPDDFFYKMADKQGYVFAHRLVMAKSLSRNLHFWEIVHHKNRVHNDNRIENLQLVSDDKHKQITLMENRIRLLEVRVLQLETELVLERQEKLNV